MIMASNVDDRDKSFISKFRELFIDEDVDISIFEPSVFESVFFLNWGHP